MQNEADDEDDDKQDHGAQKNLKQQRCLCCKQIGHSIEQCERDPNMKTINNKEDMESEFQRVTQLKDFRKLFPDTQIATTIFLKKCIKVRKYQ